MSSSSTHTLSAVVAHLIHFLTKPLCRSLPPAQLDRLTTSLHVGLTSHFNPTWRQDDPGRGRVHRKLALSASAPPDPIARACLAAQFAWPTWFAALGGVALTIYADPDALTVRKGPLDAPSHGVVTIWTAPTSKRPVKNVSRQRVESSDDEEADELFNQLEIARRAEWAALSPPRISTSQHFLRASSPNSSDSDVPSLVSATSVSSCSSSVASGVYAAPGRRAQVSHSRGSSVSSVNGPQALVYARAAAVLAVAESNTLYDADRLGISGPVHVDASRNAVTPYDGGKTTVLTGGTMLGVPRRRA